jgi:hypothetical protein
MHRAAAPVLSLALLPGAAYAHDYATGKPAYAAFLDGARGYLASPSLILPVLALAVALALWRPTGLMRLWHFFIYGTLAGGAVAPFAESWAEVLPVSVGLVVAAHAAMIPLERAKAALPWLAALTGFAVLFAAFYGHDFVEVQVATRFGLLSTANAMLAFFVWVISLTHYKIPHPATGILWRIVASWLAAIQILYLAFMLSA